MACPGPRGCPGPQGVDDQGNISNEWLCDGLGCDVGGIHTTCKKAKESEGYTFVYTRRAEILAQEHERQKAIRLARLKDDSSNT